MDHKERKGRKKTVDQVETNRYTNRNKTKETHQSRRTTLSIRPKPESVSLNNMLRLSCTAVEYTQPPTTTGSHVLSFNSTRGHYNTAVELISHKPGEEIVA